MGGDDVAEWSPEWILPHAALASRAALMATDERGHLPIKIAAYAARHHVCQPRSPHVAPLIAARQRTISMHCG